MAETEMPAHHPEMKGQRGLRHCGHAQRLRGEHEARDIAAAIDRAVDAECLVGVNDGNVRGAEEIEILQRLPGVGRLVAPGDAERVVKLKAAFAAALEIYAALFARERKVPAFRLSRAVAPINHLPHL